MIIILAAAAALVSSPQAVSVRVNVHGMDRPAAMAAVRSAARKVCRSVSLDGVARNICVQDAVDDGARQLDGLRAPVRVAAGS